MMAAVGAASPRAHSGVKRSKQAPPTVPEEEEERPRKRSRKTSSEEEKLPAETDVPPEEPTSRRPGVDSDHPSTEQEDAGRAGGPCQTSGAAGTLKEEQTSRSRVRAACPYGKDCYRKNPLHFQECSHPGDADYQEEDEEEEEDRPECPYGTDCYRKNPLHRKEFRHTQRPARSTRAAARTATRTAPDDEDADSFIDDDSLSDDDDAGGDSDYAPPGSDGSEQEDVRRLQEEATAFLRKRR